MYIDVDGGGVPVRFVELAVPTPAGTARVVLERGADPPRGPLVLGHGASGDVTAADLVAVRDEALAAGWAVARVTQPYRVDGRRRPPPRADVLDAAWVAAVAAIRDQVDAAPPGTGTGTGLPLVVGGRSLGARVACRTAPALGATGVLALAFPLSPPGRPGVSRAAELGSGIPTLVVNGDRDPFGVPEPDGAVRVVALPGERHNLSKDPRAVAAVARDWLAGLLAGLGR